MLEEFLTAVLFRGGSGSEGGNWAIGRIGDDGSPRDFSTWTQTLKEEPVIGVAETSASGGVGRESSFWATVRRSDAAASSGVNNSFAL